MITDMEHIKIWVDDIRTPPQGYCWTNTVEYTIKIIQRLEYMGVQIDEISLDHDAGEFGPPDYIKILDWLEETGRNYPIHIHSANAVGIANMRHIIQRNGWREVF